MDACMITGILCGDLIQSQFFHLYEIHEPDMAYRTGTVINIVICNYDLLAGVVQFSKSSEFPLICFLLRNRIGSLNIILLICFIGHKVDLL